MSDALNSPTPPAQRHGTPAPEAQRFFDHGVHAVEEVTIARPAHELFRLWRRLSNLPRYLSHVEQVVELDDLRSHWKVRGPAGRWEWDARIINESPGELIAWKSLEHAGPAHAGSVRFRPGPRDGETVVTVTLEFIPPGGRLGLAGARLLGEDPGTTLRRDLAGFKRLMETEPRGQALGEEGSAP